MYYKTSIVPNLWSSRKVQSLDNINVIYRFSVASISHQPVGDPVDDLDEWQQAESHAQTHQASHLWIMLELAVAVSMYLAFLTWDR